MKGLLALLAAAGALAAPPAYEVKGRVPVSGPTRWDYVFVDQRAHRLYVAHGMQTDIIDTTSDTLVGSLAGTHGVHGIATADELGLVFTSNGDDDEVGVYDLADGRRLRSISTGANPDAIVYEPVSRRVITFNGRSGDATVADAATGAVVAASIPVGGKPEFAVVDGHGLVHFNIESTAEIGTLDAGAGRVLKRYSIAPCERPTGLDTDPQGRLYSVCANGLMVISDPVAGRVLGQAGIGAGPDGVVWLDGYALSANGRDGTLSVIGETAPGRFETLATVVVARGARTIAADRVLHKLYLPTVEYLPQAPGQAEEKGQRLQPVPGSFKVFVVGAP